MTQLQQGRRNRQAKPADRAAALAATLNVGSIAAGIVAALIAREADDVSVLLLMVGLLANIVALVAWLRAGVAQWNEGRGLAIAYVVLGGGISLFFLSILFTLAAWSGA